MKSLRIKKRVDPDINVGDKVHLLDGSAFTEKSTGKEKSIIYHALEFDITKNLIDYVYTVTETNVCDYGLPFPDLCFYSQDIVVEHPNGTQFRTCSKFVQKAGG